MKKLFKNLLALLALVILCLPLSLVLAILISVVLWPIDIFVRLVESVLDAADQGHENLSGGVEEFIFASYGFCALLLFLPLEALNSEC